jgi:hypothetical protein
MEIALDYAAEAARHRKVAEEYRTLAALTTDVALTGAYRKVADAYDDLAGTEERAAQTLSKTN